jgi:hypothetical protein
MVTSSRLFAVVSSCVGALMAIHPVRRTFLPPAAFAIGGVAKASEAAAMIAAKAAAVGMQA